MSRSGYSDDCKYIALYRRAVGNALSSKRGRSFLLELRDALDAMPVKELARGVLNDIDMGCCALGAVARARGMDTSDIDPDWREQVGKRFGIAPCMAAEIAYENDLNDYSRPNETPTQRWKHMRRWVDKVLEDPRCDEH